LPEHSDMADLPIINIALYAQTDVGVVRSGNEDNFLVLDLSTGSSWTANEEEQKDLLTYQQGGHGTLLAVSDGVGGTVAGEIASRIAVETVRDRMLRLQAHGVYSQTPVHQRLRLAIEEANLLINRESAANTGHKGMGATFTAVVTEGSRVYFAQVGDSRTYLIRRGRIARVTKDQSLVQSLIDNGQITEEAAETHPYRNVILHALGATEAVGVKINSLLLCQLDLLVLCTDGLSGKVRADEIAQIVNAAADLKSACQTLVGLANKRGGEDNITVVIAQFSGSGLAQPNDERITAESCDK
jgi:serine/threonine protein phosphatase PrpC